MSVRVYLIVAVFFALMVFLVGTLFGEDIVTWAQEQQFEAQIRKQVIVEKIIFAAVVFVFDNTTAGPIIAGLAWPLVLIWLLLILGGLLVIAGVDVAGDIDEATRLFII